MYFKKETSVLQHCHAEKECVTSDNFRNTQSQYKARNCSRVLPGVVERKNIFKKSSRRTENNLAGLQRKLKR